MLLTTTLEPKTRKAWRNWLEQYHAKEKEIWLVFTKAHVGQPAFSYKDALSEALCFGWIDGVRQRIDDEKYAQRFSPRTKSSKWSAVNLSLAKELQVAGLLAPSGVASLSHAECSQADSSNPSEPFPPVWFMTAIQADPVAWTHFQNLPLSHQRRYVGWISAAKRDDTRGKRISEAISLLRENKRLGLGPGEVRK
ncbi:YdeI family protein [Geothrix sp. 21YS21S-4]|uniref:YdeI/OmpD-associated family protein n=1 Tax=Geothrix sp. 21YS21S-4 TaxID=3068889 RepID=UPI0027B8D131|nr:YdeI/OmpD-associated family protein [Geothrix sp. 21YS21S-4]